MNDNQQATQHTPGKKMKCSLNDQQLINAVFHWCDDLCMGKRNWIMSIPAMPDEDPDMLIGELLSRFKQLMSRAPDLEAENQRLRRLLKNVTDGFEELNRVCNDCHLLVTPEYNANVILIEDVKQALVHE